MEESSKNPFRILIFAFLQHFTEIRMTDCEELDL